jgi:RHS repeat-associated protein
MSSCNAKSLSSLPSFFIESALFRRVGTLRVCLLGVIVLFTGLANAQVDPGRPSFSAFDSHTVDTINLQNLNISINVPVYQKSGAFPFRYTLNANSYIQVADTGLSLAPAFFLSGMLVGGAAATYTQSATITCNGATTYVRGGWQITTADGTIHPVPGVSDTKGCINKGFTNLATDGSGYTLTVNLGTVVSIYDSAGDSLTSNLYGSFITDPNGNSISPSSTGYTDTLGVNPAFTVASQGGTYTWTDLSNNPQSVSVINTTGVTLKSAFGCGSGQISDYNIPNSSLQTSISFPDSTTMGFAYEQTPNGSSGQYTGRLEQITLRTGGVITYTYSGTNNGINCTSLSPPTLTRVTSDGTTTYTWVLNNLGNGNYGNTTTVVDNGGNATVYTFTGVIPVGTIGAPPTVQALTEVQHYQGPVSPSNLLTTDVYCYQGSSGQPGNCSTAVITPPVTEVDVYHTIPNLAAGSSRTMTQYDGGPTGSCAQGQGGCYGNVTYSAQYDFGATTPTVATTTTYGTWNGTKCVGVSSTINNKPCDVLTQQNGLSVAESRFTYSAVGNLLTTYKWTGSTWLSNITQNKYNSNGTAAKTYDLANNPTTYTYSNTSYDCGKLGCTNYLFPTSISKGGLTTSTTWYGIGGVKHQDTDASGNTTTYGYVNCTTGAVDPFWRVSSVTDPLKNEVCTTFPSGTAPDTTSSSFTFNSGNSIQSKTTTTDGYGRVTKVQKQQGPTSTNYDTVSTSYAWGGTGNNKRVVTTSIPCTTTLNATCGGTSQIFKDVLGRTTWTSTPGTTEYVQTIYTQNDVLSNLGPPSPGENLKSVQNQYDGLGRLQYSCSISSTATGNASCNQNTGTSNGVTTSYTYPSNNSGQTGVWAARGSQNRGKTYDSLGRIVGNSTPEAGNTTYTYDYTSGAPCGGTYPFPGKLVLKQTPTTFECYDYDSLGRVLDVSAGYVGQGTSACRRFRYDNSTGVVGTIPSGISPQNFNGRMVEAETDNCVQNPNVTPITDEWFSYDTDGNQTDIWELTPHSTQYYHSTAMFAGNGVVTSLQLASPALYTMNYTLDGEGRWNTLARGTLNIVTGPTQTPMYNAAGQAIEVDLTGTDKDLYTYDQNTGNMKTWEFEVGGANETGTLTWNPNNTLQQLAISDGFNAGGSQTCASSYDDLARLTVFDCGSGGWGQDFGYDQYDNLTQTKIAADATGFTWNPGYGASNNQVTGATYDASGNMTNDGGSNVYGYDQFNKLLWTASSGTPTCGTTGKCITYDAFGRMVEASNAGASTEFWYTQVPGSRVAMNGTTSPYAYWPSPGRGTFVAAGTNMFMHQDWLGNDRIVSAISTHTVSADRAYAPYGEQYNAIGSTNPVYGMFAGDTGDFDSGILLDTPNRELAQYQGRWLSPDPAGQGWNQYAYVTNPNGFNDPMGLGALNSSGGFQQYPVGNPWYMVDIFEWMGIAAGTVGADASSNPCANGCSSSLDTKPGGQYWDDGSDGCGLPCIQASNPSVLNGLLLPEAALAKGLGYLFDRYDVDPNIVALATVSIGAVPAGDLDLVLGTSVGVESPSFSGLVGSLSNPLQDDYVLGFNDPEMIGGTGYSGHALDRMQQYGITPSVVEDALANGTMDFGNQPMTFTFTSRNVTVVTNASGGVITVYP